MVLVVRLLAGIAALGAAALLAGCGGDVTSLDPVAKAASASTASQSFRFSFEAAGGTPTGAVRGDGAYDGEGKLLRMSAHVEVTSGITMTMDLLTDTSDGFVLYARFPFLTAFLPDGKTWVKVDLEKAAASAKGVDLSQLLQASRGNPADMLAALVRSDRSKELGRERVDGVDTTHYRTTVDPKEAVLAKLSGKTREQVEQLLAQAQAGQMPVDVWVGDDGLVRRLRADLPAVTAGGKSVGGGTFTEDLSGYGDPISVSLPPASQVVDATSGKLG